MKITVDDVELVFNAWAGGATVADAGALVGVGRAQADIIIKRHPRYLQAEAVRVKTYKPQLPNSIDVQYQTAQSRVIRATRELEEALLELKRLKEIKDTSFPKAIVKGNEMLELVKSGKNLREIAKMFDVSHQYVSQILQNIPEYQKLRVDAKRVTLPPIAFQRWERGENIMSLARKYDTTPSKVGKWLQSHANYETVARNRPQYNDADHVQNMVNQYIKGRTLAQLAVEFKYCSDRAVWRLLSQHPDYRAFRAQVTS